MTDSKEPRVDMHVQGADEPLMDDNIPAAEIEAAANAIQMLWDCARSKEALRYSGAGPSWKAQAQAALTAAIMVRGKLLHQSDHDIFDKPN